MHTFSTTDSIKYNHLVRCSLAFNQYHFLTTGLIIAGYFGWIDYLKTAVISVQFQPFTLPEVVLNTWKPPAVWSSGKVFRDNHLTHSTRRGDDDLVESRRPGRV